MRPFMLWVDEKEVRRKWGHQFARAPDELLVNKQLVPELSARMGAFFWLPCEFFR